MYNAAFAALDLDCHYVSFEVADLAAAIAGLRAVGIGGCSVSRPFKQAVMPLLDDVDDTAAAIGAVNVITHVGGRLRGYNSDWLGATRAIAACGPIDGRRAVVIGAGGAGRAIAYGLKAGGAQVFLVNRTPATARTVADQLALAGSGDLGALDEQAAVDIVVHATPLGCPSASDTLTLPPALLRPGQIVLDAVFRPAVTPLMRQALDAGCVVIGGLEMLVHQGAVAFELFTGRQAPVAVMRDALLRHLADESATG